MATLHITNGESAGSTLRQTGLGGDVVCWNDVLHEGPVPALPLRELSEMRARFIAESGWAPLEQVRAGFQERDDALESFGRYDEVCLWFEHDLYDQLQLLQILSWFAERDPGGTQLTLICIGEHPEVRHFHGLGQLTSDQLAALFPAREPVMDATLETARLAWRAFTLNLPQRWEDLLNDDLSALEFLRPAWKRMLQQFPAEKSGVNRTERQILEVVAKEPCDRVAAFGRCAAHEEAIFLGDTTFFWYVDGMIREPGALLAEEGVLRVTELGARVLAGEADWLDHHSIDRWYGGVHLQAGLPIWRSTGSKS